MCYCNNTFFRLCLIGVPFFQLLIYNYAFQYQTFFDISYLSSKSFIITINSFYPYWVGVSILLITYSIFSIQILIKFFVFLVLGSYWVGRSCWLSISYIYISIYIIKVYQLFPSTCIFFVVLVAIPQLQCYMLRGFQAFGNSYT